MANEKFNIYEEVTNRILAELEKGNIPWQKPWTCSTGAVSHTNGRPYSLINQMLLGEQGEYLTFKQVVAEGGVVKKGEKAKFVVFWKMYEKEEEKENGEKETKKIPILRYYNVFEVGQCDRIKRKYNGDEPTEHKPIAEAEEVVNTYFDREACELRVCESDRAFYSPSSDLVNVPQMSQYKEIAEYYSTLFHEMVHSTGHQSRLNRLQSTNLNFGSDDYSKEELVAEMGSAFIANKVGIDCKKAFKNSVAYIQSWSEKLREDKFLFVSAASKAEAAVNYIINGNIN